MSHVVEHVIHGRRRQFPKPGDSFFAGWRHGDGYRSFKQDQGFGISGWLTPSATASQRAAADVLPPRRFVGICNNLGVLGEHFFPAQAGPNYESTPYLMPLQDHRDNFSVISGVSHPNVDGAHASDVSFLTSAPFPGTGSFRNSISIDQFIAERIGAATRFPSLTLAALGALALAHPAWRMTTLAFVAVTCVLHFPLVTLHADNRYFAPLNMLRRDDRELSLQGLRVETAHRWLNEHAQAGEKVLLLADAEPFDLDLPAIYNTCFDDCQFTRIFKDRTRDERLALLREEKIAYVFCSWAHLARFRSPGNYGYTSDYPTPELVHNELVRDQQLLIPIDLGTDPASGELFRVAEK